MKRKETMETLQNSALRDRYIRENRLAELFSGKMPVMILLHYAPGDLLTTPFSPSGLLQFVVKGELLLYDMPDENSTVMLQTNYNDVKLLSEIGCSYPGNPSRPIPNPAAERPRVPAVCLRYPVR